MKSEVYSWRLSPELKTQLDRAARDENVSTSALLEHITQNWLAKRRADDEAEQRRIRARVDKVIGKISMGGGPWTNQKIRKVMQEKLAPKHGHR